MPKSNFNQLNANAVTQPLQPQPQVYIVEKSDFKSVVQQLTSFESCESLPQNPPKRQKIISEPIHQISVVQDDPDVSLYMRYLQSLLEDSPGSNGNQYQQPFDDYMQPQALPKSMSQFNGFEPVNMPTTYPSSWFNGSSQQMYGASSLQSTGVAFPQPLTPNFTFSSMTQPRGFGPDLDNVGPESFEVDRME